MAKVTSTITEAQLQKAVIDLLNRVRPACYWFHPANGGARDKITGWHLKRQGVRAGTPDIILMWAEGCEGWELKIGTGRLSNAQKETAAEFEHLGIPYRVIRNLGDAMDALKARGLVRTARAA